MRCIGWLRESPFQYAPELCSTLNALRRPVDGTCGPVQKSMKASSIV